MKKYLVLAFCIFVIGCDNYKGYDECYLTEIQKFKYEPSLGDRDTVRMACEIKFPYEKEIYGVEISLNGDYVSIISSASLYNVTKVIVLASKSECNSNPKFNTPVTFVVPDGKTGVTQFSQSDVKCYQPKSARFFGVISKDKVSLYRKLVY